MFVSVSMSLVTVGASVCVCVSLCVCVSVCLSVPCLHYLYTLLVFYIAKFSGAVSN